MDLIFECDNKKYNYRENELIDGLFVLDSVNKCYVLVSNITPALQNLIDIEKNNLNNNHNNSVENEIINLQNQIKELKERIVNNGIN